MRDYILVKPHESEKKILKRIQKTAKNLLKSKEEILELRKQSEKLAKALLEKKFEIELN